MGMYLQSACNTKSFRDLEFPEIVGALAVYYKESIVLDNFPTILDPHISKELRAELAKDYESSLAEEPIYQSVLEKLQNMYQAINEKPIVPRDAYNFEESVEVARSADCPNLVKLLQECCKRGVL